MRFCSFLGFYCQSFLFIQSFCHFSFCCFVGATFALIFLCFFAVLSTLICVHWPFFVGFLIYCLCLSFITLFAVLQQQQQQKLRILLFYFVGLFLFLVYTFLFVKVFFIVFVLCATKLLKSLFFPLAGFLGYESVVFSVGTGPYVSLFCFKFFGPLARLC